MRLWKSWVVTKKDLSVIKKNKYVLYSLFAMPLLLGVILPVILIISLSAGADQLPGEEFRQAADQVVNLGSMYLVLVPAILPSIIASYSFVGEKVEKSLEPLLATPTTDGELLLGKSLGAFVPCMAVTYLAAALFVPIINFWTFITFDLILLPNVYWSILMFLIAPLACIMSVLANVIISSRVNDVRAAQQLGGLVALPLVFIVLFGSIIAEASLMLALLVSIGIAISDIALFYLSKATFRREEILTKWK